MKPSRSRSSVGEQARRRRRPGRRRCRCRSSSPSARRRAAPSRTAAGSRRRAHAVPSTRARGCAPRGRRSSRGSASASRRRRRPRDRARRRCPRGRPGTGPRRGSPRPGPSGGRAPRRAPAPDPGGCRGCASSPAICAAIRSTSAGSNDAAQHSGDGIDGGPPDGEAGEALLVGQRRDAEPVGRHHVALPLGQDPQAVGRLERRGAEGAGQLAETVLDDLVPRRQRADALAQHRRHAAGVRVEPPDPGELGDLLGDGHPRRPGRRPGRRRGQSGPATARS